MTLLLQRTDPACFESQKCSSRSEPVGRSVGMGLIYGKGFLFAEFIPNPGLNAGPQREFVAITKNGDYKNSRRLAVFRCFVGSWISLFQLPSIVGLRADSQE